ncbi:hypothetical protein FQN57_002054 [Myotisia sp. PD_48]|nr:hypothetical protein FQN57_002054 [Myotisia sp. PD_48]
MVLELHIWGPGFGLPSIDPQCLAAIAYFSLAIPGKEDGTSEWVLVANSDPTRVPTCELPALWTGSRWISRFRNIVDFLRQYSDGKWDLDEQLSSQERADCTAFSSFIESRGQALIDLSLYVSSENYHAATAPAYASILRWPDQWIIPPKVRSKAKTRTEHLGLSSLDLDAEEEARKQKEVGRHMPTAESRIPKSLKTSPRETITGLLGKKMQQSQFRLHGITQSFVEPLEQLIEEGGGRYMIATGGPCSLDCLALAYLSLAIKPDVPSSWLKDGVQKAGRKLVAFTERMRSRCYGDANVEINDAFYPRGTNTASARLPWQAPDRIGLLDIGGRALDGMAECIPIIREIRANRRLQQLGRDVTSADDQKVVQDITKGHRRETIASTVTVLAGFGMLVWYLLVTPTVAMGVAGEAEAIPVDETSGDHVSETYGAEDDAETVL